MSFVKLVYFAAAIILALEIGQITCDAFKVIETDDGAVRGHKETTFWKSVDYYSFKGIPYAEKPIGKLRFRPPIPIKPWNSTILDAFEFGNKCIQLGSYSPDSYFESEDCLFLNIYIPADLKPSEKIPVLFFIHGGGYVQGSGNDDIYGPDFIIESRVILVTFNYRLHIFGFLSLNSSEYSGNMGLKDQQLAIKWIHKNIKYFNGDNNKITIFGGSAGSVSTQLHILSAESRKYFQSAIAMSGTVYNYWAMSDYDNHLGIAYEMAKEFGKPTVQFDKLVEILLSENPENITTSLLAKIRIDRTLSSLFGPVIETSNAVQPFMTESIDNLYDTQDINITTMFTVTSAEMLHYASQHYPIIANIVGLNANFCVKLPFRDLNVASDSEEYQTLNDAIRQFYFGNDSIDVNKSCEYIALLSDINFFYGIDKIAKLHATKAKGKTFYVRFSVDSKLNIFKRLYSEFECAGAAHADDFGYLFRVNMGKRFYDDVLETPNDEQSKISIQTIEYMTDLVTQFPNIEKIEFKPIRNLEINFLDITNEGLKPGISPNARAMEFWSNIERRVRKHVDWRQNIRRNEL